MSMGSTGRWCSSSRWPVRKSWALAAAAEAWATQSGMTWGPTALPQTKMPSFEVSTAETADVVVHNLRPPAIKRLGLEYDVVRKANPRIIYCATYGYGKAGPYGRKGALDDSIQAVSGIAALQEKVLGEPRYLPTVVADKTTGLFVAQAVLAALFHRERTGEGQEIEVPMYESMVSWVMVEHLWGQTFEPPMGPAGYVRLMAEHRKPYRCSDGLYLAVLPYWDAHWHTFCELSGHPELGEDPRFTADGYWCAACATALAATNR